MRISITLVLLFISLGSYSYRDDLALKGGLSYSSAKINGTYGSEDEVNGVGFNTHLSYRLERSEFSLSSYIFWGNIEGLRFNARSEEINGEGSYRHVSFSPMYRYHFSHWEPLKNWFFFAGLGPVWSIQTVKFDHFTSTGPLYHQKQKLVFESTGGSVVVGIEEELEHKEMHPVFIELHYSYKKSHKVSVVDASDFSEVITLSVEERKQDLDGHFFMVSVGFTLF